MIINRINYKLTAVIVAAVAMLGACSSEGEKGGVKEDSASVEEARVDARNAARRFLNRPWKDTVELQSQLLEARALQSKYVQEGRLESAAAFDSTFVSTLKTVRPEMAAELERARANASANKQAQ